MSLSGLEDSTLTIKKIQIEDLGGIQTGKLNNTLDITFQGGDNPVAIFQVDKSNGTLDSSSNIVWTNQPYYRQPDGTISPYSYQILYKEVQLDSVDNVPIKSSIFAPLGVFLPVGAKNLYFYDCNLLTVSVNQSPCTLTIALVTEVHTGGTIVDTTLTSVTYYVASQLIINFYASIFLPTAITTQTELNLKIYGTSTNPAATFNLGSGGSYLAKVI
jgi:hypothetical protein